MEQTPFHPFFAGLTNIQRRKSDANKQDFENKFNLVCHAQSTPKTTGILTKVFSTSGPNLVGLAWTGDELSRRQAQNGVNFDFEVKFDLEGQGQSPPKTIGILTKVFYIYGPNLVILAETGHELSRGQARDWHTDGHTHTQTDAGNDNTRRPMLASGKKPTITKRVITNDTSSQNKILLENMNIVFLKFNLSSWKCTNISMAPQGTSKTFSRFNMTATIFELAKISYDPC